jgi:hypothetical protein
MISGKADIAKEENERCTLRFHRGKGDGMHTRGRSMQHGKPPCVVEASTNRKPVKARPGAMGWRKGPQY